MAETSTRREQIARIIDPEAWSLFDEVPNKIGAQKYVEPSLAKADAIIALPAPPAVKEET